MRKTTLGLALLLGACAGERLDVGDDPATDGTSGGSSSGTSSARTTNEVPSEPLPAWPATTGCDTDPEFSELLGTWQGQVDDFYLQPLVTMRVVINGASGHGMCGTVTFGDGEPPAPATDPNAVYPSADFWGAGVGLDAYRPIIGFAYTIDQGAVRDRTARFSTQVAEPWGSWCVLQPSYPTPEGWACLPYYEGGTTSTSDPNGLCETGGHTFPAFSCYACGLYNSWSPLLCACSEGGCDAQQENPFPFELTLSDDHTVLTGSVPSFYAFGVDQSSYYLKHVN